jgi:regulator of protease activity HflC (stomatin/prohibitin superfamily)
MSSQKLASSEVKGEEPQYHYGGAIYVPLALAILFPAMAMVMLATGGPSGTVVAVVIIMIGVIVLMALELASMQSVRPDEIALVSVLGSFKGFLKPGISFTSPVAVVMRISRGIQEIAVPNQEVVTKDNSVMVVSATVFVKVIDAMAAVYKAPSGYRAAMAAEAKATLHATVTRLSSDEVRFNKEKVNTTLKNFLSQASSDWGIRVESVSIRDSTETWSNK